MSSERHILKRLLEGKVDYEEYEEYEECSEEPTKDLDEKTYTVGDKQYWKRAGKCYCWTSSGGKQECSEEEYMKAISGGNDNNEAPKNTEPKDDKARQVEPYKPTFREEGNGLSMNVRPIERHEVKATNFSDMSEQEREVCKDIIRKNFAYGTDFGLGIDGKDGKGFVKFTNSYDVKNFRTESEVAKFKEDLNSKGLKNIKLETSGKVPPFTCRGFSFKVDPKIMIPKVQEHYRNKEDKDYENSVKFEQAVAKVDPDKYKASPKQYDRVLKLYTDRFIQGNPDVSSDSVASGIKSADQLVARYAMASALGWDGAKISLRDRAKEFGVTGPELAAYRRKFTKTPNEYSSEVARHIDLKNGWIRPKSYYSDSNN